MGRVSRKFLNIKISGQHPPLDYFFYPRPLILLTFQVNQLVDVSCPLYGQLQKLTGKENANVNVTATQPTQTQVQYVLY